MTTYVPPKKNGSGGWIGYVSLAPQTATGAWQSNPTLATGDVKVSIDGGALANLGTLPAVTPASSKLVKITLSQAEINGDNITIIFSDQTSPAEWCDKTINLQTSARQYDDLAYPATSGRSMVVDASGLVDANTVKVGPSGSGTAQTARDIGASVLLSSGTGTGQVSLSSGLVDITQTAADKAWGTAVRVLTAGTNIQLPSNGLANVTAWTVAITGNITGNLSGSVGSVTGSAGSVTGAVGSVTGNVGGNVVGSVGSVTGLTASNLDVAVSTRLASASYTAPDNTSITAIKAKTDSLTFTVAGQLDANIQYVNDVQVTGTGTSGNPWGP